VRLMRLSPFAQFIPCCLGSKCSNTKSAGEAPACQSFQEPNRLHHPGYVTPFPKMFAVCSLQFAASKSTGGKTVRCCTENRATCTHTAPQYASWPYFHVASSIASEHGTRAHNQITMADFAHNSCIHAAAISPIYCCFHVDLEFSKNGWGHAEVPAYEDRSHMWPDRPCVTNTDKVMSMSRQA
jgi:hypothetical protein